MTERELPFVFSIPHCSSRVPEDVRRGLALTEAQIEESTDVGTAEIFGTLPGAAVLQASWSRLTVDLNRDPAQRDPKGVVALVDYGGRAIFRSDAIPAAEEVEHRILAYYRPYHQSLQRVLRTSGVKALIDCHSLCGVGPEEAPDRGQKRKDITLSNNGDPEGCALASLGLPTCERETLEIMKECFEACGFSVSLNRPYSGGYITTHYGRRLAEEGKLAVQIEINQDLFCIPGSVRIVPQRAAEVRERVLRAFSRIAKTLP